MYNEDYFDAYDVFDGRYLDDYYMDEKWAWIDGFYREYMISDKSRVYSCKTDTILKQKIMDKAGHLGVQLHSNGRSYYYYVHRLMADAFIANSDNYPIVRHLNDLAWGNELENLAWGTQKLNHMDSVKNGTYKPFTNEARLISIEKSRTPIIATDLNSGKKLYFNSQKEAARVLNLNQSNIWKVLNGERKHTCNYFFEFDYNGGGRFGNN